MECVVRDAGKTNGACLVLICVMLIVDNVLKDLVFLMVYCVSTFSDIWFMCMDVIIVEGYKLVDQSCPY